MGLFRLCGATAPGPNIVLTDASSSSKTDAMDLEQLSRALPLWIFVALTMLGLYFRTQQDISVESITADAAATKHQAHEGDAALSSHPVRRISCMTCLLPTATSAKEISNPDSTPDPRDRASVHHAAEDRRRRHELRAKCTAAIASSSLLSLVALVGVVQFTAWEKGKGREVWWSGIGRGLK